MIEIRAKSEELKKRKSPLRPLFAPVFCFLVGVSVVSAGAAAARFGRVDAAVSSTGFAPTRPGRAISIKV